VIPRERPITIMSGAPLVFTIRDLAMVNLEGHCLNGQFADVEGFTRPATLLPPPNSWARVGVEVPAYVLIRAQGGPHHGEGFAIERKHLLKAFAPQADIDLYRRRVARQQQRR